MNSSEFYAILAEKTDLTEEQVKEFYELLIDYTIKTMMEYGEITLPYFGRIAMRNVEGRKKRLPTDENGDKTYVPEHWQPSIKWHKSFVKCLNGKQLTHYETLLLRNGIKADRKRMEERDRQKTILLEREKLLANIRMGRMKQKHRDHEKNKRQAQRKQKGSKG